jgi:hypothetical protein
VKLYNDGIISPPKKAPHKYTPSSGPARRVWELPTQDWNHVLCEDKVFLYDMKRKDGSTEKAWNLEVRNMKDPSSAAFRIFNFLYNSYNVHGREAVPDVDHCNAITQKFCSDRSEVIRLGTIYADIMNRMPVPPDVTHWTEARPRHVKLWRPRKFIDLAALIRWNPNVNFHDLHEDFIDHPTGTATMGNNVNAAYGIPMQIVQKGKSTVSTKTYALYYATDREKDAGIPIACPIKDTQSTAVGSRSDIPAGFSFCNTFTNPDGPEKAAPHDLSDDKTRSAVRIVQSVFYQLSGMIGTEKHLMEAIDDLLSQHGAQTPPRLTLGVGSYNGIYPFRTPRKQGSGSVSFSWPRKLLQWLGVSDDDLVKVCATMASTNRICHVYAFHQFLIALRAGKPLLHAIQAIFVAADEVGLGIVTISQIKSTYCLCKPQERINTEHLCMHCYKIFNCTQLALDDQCRLLCRLCGGQPNLSDNRMTIAHVVKASVRHAHDDDKASGSNQPNWTVNALCDQLLRQHQLTTTTWKDGYDGEVSFDLAQYADICQIGVANLKVKSLTHPSKPSVEKVLPCWLDEDNGKLYLHHPKNITLTQLCTNASNRLGVPAMIPLDKVAVELADQTQNLKPVSGYDKSVAQGWQTFERATDSIYAAAIAFPLQKKARTRSGQYLQNPTAFQAVVRQFKTGVWDAKTTPRPFTSRAEAYGWNSKRNTSRFDTDAFIPWTQSITQKLSEQLDFLAASTRFNPYGLSFLRNEDGSPWFWRPDHRHPNADWTFLNREFQARFWTMDELCDELNETQETPITLFLCYAIHWLRTGGKCHFFGCVMTFAMAHPSVYSIGRAVTVRDNDGVYIRDVVAGEAMRTGFSTPHPTDIETQFDFSRCTITFETWRANSIRSNFPGGETMIQHLKDTVRSRSLSTEWYDAPKEIDQYPKLPRPGHYNVDAIRTFIPVRPKYRSTGDFESDAEDDEFGSEDDEFDEFDDELTQAESEVDRFDEIGSGDEEEGVGPDGKNQISEAEDEHGVGETGGEVRVGGTIGEDEQPVADLDGKWRRDRISCSNADGTNTSAVHISSTSQTKIVSRHGDETRLKTSVDDDHLMAGLLVSAGKAPRDVHGYPTKDNFFCTYIGVKRVARFDGAGNVFDMEGNFLGNPIVVEGEAEDE